MLLPLAIQANIANQVINNNFNKYIGRRIKVYYRYENLCNSQGFLLSYVIYIRGKIKRLMYYIFMVF